MCEGIDRRLQPAVLAAAKKLQRSLKQAPLYAVPASAAGVASCRFGEDSGVLTLEYRFRDGGWLRVRRDPRIEYSEQEAHLSAALMQRPEALLGRAERAAFAPEGCGIDWKQPQSELERQPVEGSPDAEETVFRGEACNCQARIRRDAAKRVVALLLRSAC